MDLQLDLFAHVIVAEWVLVAFVVEKFPVLVVEIAVVLVVLVAVDAGVNVVWYVAISPVVWRAVHLLV